MYILLKLLGFDATQSRHVDTDISEEHAASFSAEGLGPNLALQCQIHKFVSDMYKKSSHNTNMYSSMWVQNWVTGTKQIIQCKHKLCVKKSAGKIQ
jgi:hypothetical protein